MTYKTLYPVVLLALHYCSFDTSAQVFLTKCYTCGNFDYTETACNDPIEYLDPSIGIVNCPTALSYSCLKAVASNGTNIRTVRSCVSTASASTTCNSLAEIFGELKECTTCRGNLCNGVASEDSVTTVAANTTDAVTTVAANTTDAVTTNVSNTTVIVTTPDPSGSHGSVLTLSFASILFMIISQTIY